MGIDVLVLNTAVADFRRPEFSFADQLVGPGGLARCETKNMPKYTQEQVWQWIQEGSATAGGPGNCAPLMSKAGLEVVVGVTLGKGDFDGLDAQGYFFRSKLEEAKVGVHNSIHPSLPTGTTFIHDSGGSERGGIAYFPNANNAFNFEIAWKAVKKLKPKVVWYMYSGLSESGDANNGKDLADFMKECRERGILTMADSHTLTGNPEKMIRQGVAVPEYRLLEPLLPQLDIFFTSYDEARMIANTLSGDAPKINSKNFIDHMLFWLMEKSIPANKNHLVGITTKNGAYGIIPLDEKDAYVTRVDSKFKVGSVIDLVGAGDAFRAGVVTYLVRNINKFKGDNLDPSEILQMGNLFATCYIIAPLNNRYSLIRPYKTMMELVQSPNDIKGKAELLRRLG